MACFYPNQYLGFSFLGAKPLVWTVDGLCDKNDPALHEKKDSVPLAPADAVTSDTTRKSSKDHQMVTSQQLPLPPLPLGHKVSLASSCEQEEQDAGCGLASSLRAKLGSLPSADAG